MSQILQSTASYLPSLPARLSQLSGPHLTCPFITSSCLDSNVSTPDCSSQGHWQPVLANKSSALPYLTQPVSNIQKSQWLPPVQNTLCSWLLLASCLTFYFSFLGVGSGSGGRQASCTPFKTSYYPSAFRTSSALLFNFPLWGLILCPTSYITSPFIYFHESPSEVVQIRALAFRPPPHFPMFLSKFSFPDINKSYHSSLKYTKFYYNTSHHHLLVWILLLLFFQLKEVKLEKIYSICI